jgi:hypothetical protein
MCSLIRRGRLNGDVFPAEIKPSLFIHGGHDGVEGPLDVDQPSRL